MDWHTAIAAAQEPTAVLSALTAALGGWALKKIHSIDKKLTVLEFRCPLLKCRGKKPDEE